MKVIAFHGSPRQGGNTEILLEETLKPINAAMHDVIVFKLNSMNIMPCQDCGDCDNTGTCIIDDDMQKIYPAIREADRIILASPIFFLGLSAQTKIMIDRCQAFWHEKYVLKRPVPEGPFGRKGLFLLVGGRKKPSELECVEATAKAFFRTVNVASHEMLGITGVAAKGAVLEHPTALRDAHDAGRKLVLI